MHLISRTRPLGALAATFSLVTALGGCGGGDSGGAAPPAAGGTLSIVYAKAFSSFDGLHTFKVPVMVMGVKGVSWSAEPALVDIETIADDDTSTGSEAMLTTKGAGTVTIKARAGNLEGTAVLSITQAAPTAWDVGKARYNDGVTLRPGPGMPPGMVNKAAACTNCHGTALNDVEHTPAQIGGYSDLEVTTIFTLGKKPAGVPNRIVPAAQWTAIHQWQMTEEEKAGLVVYLRALAPQSQGTLDFGGRGIFRGPGMRPDGGFGGDGGGRRGDGGFGREGGGGGGPADPADAGATD